MLFSRSFMVSGLTFRSLIHFEYIFVYDTCSVLVSFFYVELSCFPVPVIEETVFSPLFSILTSFLPPLSQIKLPQCMGLVLGSLSCCTDLCVCLCALPYGFDYCTFVVQSEDLEGETSSFVLFSQDSFGNSGCFEAPYKVQDYLFQFCGKCHRYFDRNCIKSVDCFGKYGH